MSTQPSFPGFDTRYDGNNESNFFMYPNILSQHWYYLAGSEQKVLDFILRQTIGWRKSKDRIALSQFVNGAGDQNMGTGLSISQVQRAIKGLEEKGFIQVDRDKNRPSVFSLVLADDEEKALDPKAFTAFKDLDWEYAE